MTESPVPGPGTSREASPPARTIVRAVLRAAGTTAALVVIYYLLPLDRSSAGVAVTMLVTGLVALIGLITFQVRWILGARFPGLRAVEALATSLSLFLVLFASTYLVIATESAGSCQERQFRPCSSPMTASRDAAVPMRLRSSSNAGALPAQ